MDPATTARLSRTLWSAVPLLFGLAGVVLSNLPFGISGGILVSPLFALMAVYFWALHRPELLPPVVTLVLGLAQDLVTGGPPGLWALVFLAVHLVTVGLRKLIVDRVFLGVWAAFGLIALAADLIAFMLASLHYGVLLPIGPFLVQALATSVIYPFAGRLFAWVHLRFLATV